MSTGGVFGNSASNVKIAISSGTYSAFAAKNGGRLITLSKEGLGVPSSGKLLACIAEDTESHSSVFWGTEISGESVILHLQNTYSEQRDVTFHFVTFYK